MSKTVIDFVEATHTYLVNGVEVPGVTQVIRHITSDHYGAILPSVLDHARRRGSMIHEVTEMLEYGVDLSFPEEILGYIRAYLAFCRDYRPVWEGIEQIVYDENRRVCGTVDRHGLVGGKRWIVDIKNKKTPTRENYISDCCQTAAYSQALGFPYAKRVTLYLREDGDYRLFHCDEFEKKNGFSGIELFDRCLTLENTIRRLKENGKRNRNV